MRSAFIAVLLSLIPFWSVAQDSPLKPDGRMWARREGGKSGLNENVAQSSAHRLLDGSVIDCTAAPMASEARSRRAMAS